MNITTQQEFEKYFKAQINWREFNYILDIITEYQDNGIEISLSVVVHIKSGGRYDDVYLMGSKGANFHDYSDYYKYNDKVYNIIVDNSKTEGLLYMVRPDDFRVDPGSFKGVFKQLQNRLSNRFDSIVLYNCLLIRYK